MDSVTIHEIKRRWPNASASTIARNVDPAYQTPNALPSSPEPEAAAMTLAQRLWAAYQQTGSVHRACRSFGISGETLRQRLLEAGYRLNNSKWTARQLERLTQYYNNTPVAQFSIQTLADELKRTFAAVAIRAQRCGLTGRRTDPNEFSDIHRARMSAAQSERMKSSAQRLKQSATAQQWHEEHDHPRGFAGHHRTAEEKAKIGAAAKEMWADPDHPVNSAAHRQRLSDRFTALAATRTSVNTFSRTRKGFRDDLGVSLRSSWEANYARYLNFLMVEGSVKSWKYEPMTFWFLEIKRGVRSYRPDFGVVLADGSLEYHEVKGWHYPRGKTALKRMRIYHPEIKIVLIDQVRYRAIAKAVSKIIPGWE